MPPRTTAILSVHRGCRKIFPTGSITYKIPGWLLRPLPCFAGDEGRLHAIRFDLYSQTGRSPGPAIRRVTAARPPPLPSPQCDSSWPIPARPPVLCTTTHNDAQSPDGTRLPPITYGLAARVGAHNGCTRSADPPRALEVRQPLRPPSTRSGDCSSRGPA